jgi:pimeloyl-ACP methyl ester carboxylesterase
MSTFVLIPGAGGTAWYWHRVVPLLEEADHRALAVDLPGDDPRAGLEAYADLVIGAIGKRRDVTLVAQSLGGFTAAIVASRVALERLVFVNAMIPNPGETPGEWWKNTDWEKARMAAAARHGYGGEFDLATYFLHDVPKDVVEEGAAHQRDEAKVVFDDPARFDAWPDIPIHVVAGKDDRFFPCEFQIRVARERLGTAVDEIAGGHLLALSQPRATAELLSSYAAKK